MAEAVGAGPETAPAVVATAGHIDHGKSSLIMRLTGIDPDRLAEEKRRGLTIELGYAWCTLPSGREVGFVDVPGHERFVRTMLAGVGPVRLVLFVVAADEGWRLQSEEHLEIVDVLGVDGAVVALTKRDLVEPRELPRISAEISERLVGTALRNARVIPCSSVTGDGMVDLVMALDAMLAVAPEPQRDGRARQFIDRVFTIAGAGTVVTGTLTGGPIAVGQEVETLPSGSRARIRSLQTHRRELDVAIPVSRVAANLVGVERRGVERGEVLVRPDEWRATDVLEARLRPVRSLSRPMTSRGAFKLYAGSAERDARVRLYDVGELPEGGAFARIRLSAPAVLEVGDRFVLRESGRRETVAGGVVLDPYPPGRPRRGAGDRLTARERADRSELPTLLVAERGAVRVDDVALLVGSRPEVVPGAVRVGAWWVAGALLESVRRALATRLTRFHASAPHVTGLSLSALRPAVVRELRAAGAPADVELASGVIEGLVAQGLLEREHEFVRLASHKAEVPAATREVVEAVRSGGPTPPTLPELLTAGFGRDLIESAVRSGELVRVSAEIVLTPGFVDRALEAVREAGERGITVSALRERLGTTRRYAVPLMEYLDRTGATRRAGDLRFARTRP